MRTKIDSYYEPFLALPVPVVLAVLWIVGAMFEVATAAALYEGGLVLLHWLGAILSA